MTKRIRKRGAKSRPRGRERRHYPIDKAWQLGIKAILAERRLSQADLARMAKASPPAITLLLQEGTNVSTLVAAVHEALGLEPPPATTKIVRLPQPDTAAA